tara:strand:+ start:20460 stop:20705 length:246 start_codon:yes stop_codon:yes gene_type:complete
MTAFDYFSNVHPEIASRQIRILHLLKKVREHHAILSERLNERFCNRLYDRTWELLQLERSLQGRLHQIDLQYEAFATRLVG